ncbi:MAG: DNA replication and repair protein RecF [Chloroflexi bacterium]|nr:MAG: DNA replication and repair protein RecF [Chloroflexota bacterium]
MYLRTLELDAFRSYDHLRLTLPPGLTLFIGDNAAGKSNLLEAIAVLAMTRSPRATTEGEMIGWPAITAATREEPAVARIAGQAERSQGPVQVEIALVARADAQGRPLKSRSGAPLSSKRLRLNGIARRATEIVGQIGAVLFTTLDIEILTGPPSRRRRFLDLLIAQSDRGYARAYSTYDKAVTQRNAVLKHMGAGDATAAELAPWDDVLAHEGGIILAARASAVAALAELAPERHRFLTSGDEAGALRLAYLPALGPPALGLPALGPPTLARGVAPAGDPPDAAAASGLLRDAMAAVRRREVGAGTTLVGPHRDDLSLTIDARPAGAYASRAQQRSVALALRLAEADLLRQRTGEAPILLLDDLFSELDVARREATAAALADTLGASPGTAQLLVTTADARALPDALPGATAGFRIADGRVETDDAL